MEYQIKLSGDDVVDEQGVVNFAIEHNMRIYTSRPLNHKQFLKVAEDAVETGSFLDFRLRQVGLNPNEEETFFCKGYINVEGTLRMMTCAMPS